MTFWSIVVQQCCAPTALVLLVSVLTTSSLPRSTCAPTTLSPTENITIPVPDGSSNHGNPNLLCTPTKWTDIATFFLANFVAHAATVKSLPGEPIVPATANVMIALLFPASGIIRALSAIWQYAVFAATPLKTAARARALCMVVRTRTWKPQTGDTSQLLGFNASDEFKNSVVHERGFEFLNLREAKTDDRPFWIKWTATNLLELELSLLEKLLTKLGAKREKSIRESKNASDKAEQKVPTLVVKSPGKESQLLYNPFFVPSVSILGRRGRQVHGVCQLPQGYALAIVPAETEISEISDAHCDVMRDIERRDEEKRQDERVNSSKQNNGVYGKEEQFGEKQNKRHWKSEVRGNKAHSASKLKRIFLDLGVMLLEQKQLEKDRMKTQGPASRVIQLSSKNDLAKGLIAIFQTLYAGATLYRSRGDQIERYGYAAFGITVSPYLIMSIVNLFSTFLTPDYPTLYMVRNHAMIEASKREGAKFEGIVGSIQSPCVAKEALGKITFESAEDGRMLLELGPGAASAGHIPSTSLPTKYVTEDPDLQPPWSRKAIERASLMIPSCSGFDAGRSEIRQSLERFCVGLASVAVTSISIVINGALSHFHHGHSTHAQRVWTMTWLAFGIAFGPLSLTFDSIQSASRYGFILYGAPAIGGFIVVGQMLMEYGHCVQLSGGIV